MIDEKLMKRVRRLYAMAQDASSPNEAAIAARRARKLMDEHGIKAADLETSEFNVSFAKGYKQVKRLPKWYTTLAIGVSELNDVVGKREPGGVTFSGYEVDVISANLMMEYLCSSMQRQLEQYLKLNAHLDGRVTALPFREGFSVSIRERLHIMAHERTREVRDTDTGQALVPMKMSMVNQEFGETKANETPSNVDPANLDAMSAYMAGDVAGSNTSLNEQVTTETRKEIEK